MMAEFGNHNTGTSDDYQYANQYTATPANVPSNGVLQSLSLYARTAGQKFKLALYDATGEGGKPGALLAQTEEGSAATNNTWVTLNTTTNPTLTAGQSVWIAFVASNLNPVNFRAATGSYICYTLATTGYPTVQNPFPGSFTYAEVVSMYGTVLSSSRRRRILCAA
jgi:hypothetical protein